MTIQNSAKEKIVKLIEKFVAAVRRYDDENNFTCDICGREVFDNARVCTPCYNALPWNDEVICPFCGRKQAEEGVCLECKQKPLGVEKARSAFTHEGDAMSLVLRLKKGSKYLYRTLAVLTLPLFIAEFSESDLLTCVPMTEQARKRRGYNQSKLIAEELAKKSGKPFAEVVVKQRETTAQKTLGRREREKNLEGCFHVTDRAAVKGKRVLIIDDTLTTGATVSELADALKRAGAQEVCALTVTSVQNKAPFGK